MTVAGFDLITTSGLVYWLVDWIVYQINIDRGSSFDPGRCLKKNKTTGVTVEQSHECVIFACCSLHSVPRETEITTSYLRKYD
jgi:hypothetical protein